MLPETCRFLSGFLAGWRRDFSGRGLLVGLVAAGLLSGCVPLGSLDEIQQRLPEDEFLELDGQVVHVERRGAGAPVVLLHGFGGSTFSWRKVIPQLASRFDVVAIDLNGFGFTERPSGVEPYSLNGQAQLVLAVMDALGLHEAIVVGHSYGANVALLIAAQRPDRISRLVLVDGGPIDSAAGGGPPGGASSISAGVVRLLLTEGSIRKMLRAFVYDPAVVDDEMVRGYLQRLRVEGLDRVLTGLTQSASGTLPPPESVGQQTLVLWGEQDPVFPVCAGEEMHKRFPVARFERIALSGHLPMEEQPDEFAVRLIEFATAP